MERALRQTESRGETVADTKGGHPATRLAAAPLSSAPLYAMPTTPISLSMTAQRLQPKLSVSSPEDEFEQEADRVAERVMRMPDSTLRLQRKCACGGGCEECSGEKPRLQRRAASHADGGAPAPSIVGDVLGTPGTPLDRDTRAFMEPRFGRDFGDVRVHTDARAAKSAQAVNALAYAVGRDVVFGLGRYAPETGEGRRLLAHELAHVVQQRGSAEGGAGHVQRQSTTPLTTAPAAAALTVSGDATRTSPTGGVAIRNGTLTWSLRFIGQPGSSSVAPGGGINIVIPQDVIMDATFTPSSGAGGCPTITFIQIVRPTIGGLPDTSHLLFTRDRTSGFGVDVQSHETEPYYGAGPAASGPGLGPEHSNTTLAGTAPGRSATATFGDAPTRPTSHIPPGQTMRREFEVAVICVETGETFGSILWGYTKTRTGVITLLGAQASDVQTTGATAEVEATRQAFYRGYFQHSLSGFARGSATLTPAHRATIQTIATSGSMRRIVLVGSNDFSGGPAESSAALSLSRAEAVRAELVRLGVSASSIEVQGHGVTARVPNPQGQSVPANRRVDVHIERGMANLVAGQEGSPHEAMRFRRQDPQRTIQELIDLLMELQSTSGTIPISKCNQLTHMQDGLRHRRAADPTVPNTEELYGPTIRTLRRRCESLIPRAEFEYERPELVPPRFAPGIREGTEGPPF